MLRLQLPGQLGHHPLPPRQGVPQQEDPLSRRHLVHVLLLRGDQGGGEKVSNLLYLDKAFFLEFKWFKNREIYLQYVVQSPKVQLNY